MKILFTLFGVIGSCLLGMAQLPVTSLPACGQHTTIDDLEILTSQQAAIHKHTVSFAKAPISIPLTIHLVARSNQQDGLSEAALNKTISDLNAQFLAANVQFFICSIHLIASDDYFDFNKGLESEITREHNVEGTLNLYFVNNIIGASGLICGYAYLPSADKHYIFLTNDCVVNGTTHIHEVGHYFGLYHTHGKFNQQLTEELVDGSNCTTAGDDVCDTPADPNVGNWSDDACNYTGNLRDINDDLFQPDPRNIMSYGNNSCRDFFTDGQYQRIAYFADQLDKQLKCPIFAVDFTADQKIESCQNNLTVQFLADITHPNLANVTYEWDVNDDGKVDYTLPNPQHTYEAAGTYSVALTIFADGKQVSKTKKDYIELQAAITTDFVDSLENGLERWSIHNPDEEMTWGIDEISGCKSENGVARFNNFNYNAVGQRDYLQLQRIDLRYFSVPTLNFNLAYAPYSNDYSDELVIQISTDCFVEDITTVYQKKGIALSTAGTSTTAFQPQQCSDWRTEQIELAAFQGQEVSIRFVNINGYGNYLYLDDVSVEEAAVAPLSIANTSSTASVAFTNPLIDFTTEVANLQVYPNPATNKIWISVPQRKLRKVQYQISNTNGKILHSGERAIRRASTQFAVEVNELEAGVYFLQVMDNHQIQTEIFTIY